MLKSKFKIFFHFLLVCQVYVSAASLPQNYYGSNTEGCGNGDLNNGILKRVINGVDTLGTGGWILNDQTPTKPELYWTHETLDTMQNADTLVFLDGDSISIWTSEYAGFLRGEVVHHSYHAVDSSKGLDLWVDTGYFKNNPHINDAAPIEDDISPFLIFLSFYCFSYLVRWKSPMYRNL